MTSSSAVGLVAQTLVDARREAHALVDYPGALPTTLQDAYAVQAEFIRRWGTPVAGWKVGRITGEAEARFGRNRFIGPIFAETVHTSTIDAISRFPAIAGGTAALEAEVVAILGEDVAPLRRDWTADAVRPLLSGLHIGIEVAGCPLLDVGRFGPLVSIAASGNNLAMILGPAIPGWRDIDIDMIPCSVTIDGAPIDTGTAASLPGGPLTAIAFALNTASELGFPLPAGTLLSTGAITGVHPVAIGQHGLADFGDLGTVRCTVVEAMPAA